MSLVSALAFAAILPMAVAAQDAAPAKTAVEDGPSKWDIFAGYSYLAPHGQVAGNQAQAINYGSIFSVSRYFNK